MARDGETVTPSLPKPDVWTGMVFQCRGGFEVEAGKNPSRLVAEKLSGRIMKPDIRKHWWPSFAIKPNVAIGRGPYTSTYDESIRRDRALGPRLPDPNDTARRIMNGGCP